VSEITLRVEGDLIASDDAGGFDLLHTDEETALDIFRAWYRSERARLDREHAAEARRARFRVVATPRP
jgi:hypothetical protein